MIRKIFGKKISINDSELQDSLFLFGIFIVTSILIIGLFPDRETDEFLNRNFFIYAVMTLPVIAAMYFIVISFRRNLYPEEVALRSSIRRKIGITLIFVCILPSLPIVIISNHILNQTLSGMLFDRTSNALNEAVTLSGEMVTGMGERVRSEAVFLADLIDRDYFTPQTAGGREEIRRSFDKKGMLICFYGIGKAGKENFAWDLGNPGIPFSQELVDYFGIAELNDAARVDRLSLSGKSYMVGSVPRNGILTALCLEVPGPLDAKAGIFEVSLRDYKNLEHRRNFLKSWAGFFFLSLSVIMIIVSILISLYLSKSISKPVLELTEAAKRLSAGNFDVKLERDYSDEMGLLFKTFNRMIVELDRNRKAMFQKQRLEAWKDVAKRVVHEIKNPLTPIRLSAERMRKRFLEKHPDIENIIISGTDTIIEEVEVLMNILKEFTNFARLPEMKAERVSVSDLIESCVNIFTGHENIVFEVDPGRDIPDIYGDKILLRQAITNILQNAVDAIKESGKITIKTGLVENGGEKNVVVSIADTGSGIMKEDLGRIFEPGFSTKSYGSGLGLAIVDKIVFEHNGRLTCRSVFGEGAEFIIEFPVDSGV